MAYNGPFAQPVPAGGTGEASFTATSLIASGASTTSALQSVSNSSAGNIMASNGTSLPSFQTPSGLGASLKLIQTQNANTVSAVTFTTGIASPFRNFLLTGDVINMSSTQNLIVQFSSNGGSSYISSGYNAGANQWDYNSTTPSANFNINSGVFGVPGLSSSYISAFQLWIYNLTSGSIINCIGSGTSNAGSTTTWFFQLIGSYNTATAMNALQVIAATGTITTANFSLYGVSV